VLVAVQLRDAHDLDDPVGVHRDDRAHLLQDADQVDDLRLDGRVRNSVTPSARTAVRRTCSVRPDARVGQFQLRAVQSVGGAEVHALGRLVDDRAELAQRLDVEVDRARADVAAAEVRDERATQPVHQRAAEQDRDPGSSRRAR